VRGVSSHGGDEEEKRLPNEEAFIGGEHERRVGCSKVYEIQRIVCRGWVMWRELGNSKD